MTKIIDVTQYLEKIAPLHLQESYDNAGLICGHQYEEVKGVLVSLDCIESIVDEAIRKQCNLIVSHHPIIFKGLKSLTGQNYVERTVMKAIKHDIAIYAIHTNLDNVLDKGVNERIAQRIGLVDIQPLIPKDIGDESRKVGTGVIGIPNKPMPTMAYLHMIKDAMSTSCVKHTAPVKDVIKRVAVCGGSGSSFLKNAIRANADLYITADFKYHEYFDAEDDIIIADIGHYESEQYTIDLLYEIITNKFRNFAAYYTEVNTNPVKYLF